MTGSELALIGRHLLEYWIVDLDVAGAPLARDDKRALALRLTTDVPISTLYQDS
jgi:hypothetical protein